MSWRAWLSTIPPSMLASSPVASTAGAASGRSSPRWRIRSYQGDRRPPGLPTCPGNRLEAGAADTAGQGHGLAAGDLVLAEDLEEVQVAEFPGSGLGQAGVQGGEHAGQLEVAQRGCERAAVGDGDSSHDVASSVVPGVTASLGIVPGMGMTFANDAGPRRKAAAPPSPAAAGNWSRSFPAARMPLTVR